MHLAFSTALEELGAPPRRLVYTLGGASCVMAPRANWNGGRKLSTDVIGRMEALRRGVQAERGGSPSESAGSRAQKRTAARPAPLERASAKRRRASCAGGLQGYRRKIGRESCRERGED